MAKWLTGLPLDQKVQGSIPGSKVEQDGQVVKMPLDTKATSCVSVTEVAQTQAQEVYFNCLPPCLSDEMLNGGLKSIT